MGLISARLEGIRWSSIALSIIAMIIDKLAKAFLCQITVMDFLGTVAERRQRFFCTFHIIIGIIIKQLNSHLLSRH